MRVSKGIWNSRRCWENSIELLKSAGNHGGKTGARQPRSVGKEQYEVEADPKAGDGAPSKDLPWRSDHPAVGLTRDNTTGMPMQRTTRWLKREQKVVSARSAITVRTGL